VDQAGHVGHILLKNWTNAGFSDRVRKTMGAWVKCGHDLAKNWPKTGLQNRWRNFSIDRVLNDQNEVFHSRNFKYPATNQHKNDRGTSAQAAQNLKRSNDPCIATTTVEFSECC
jgi:hypothetical protein